MKLTKDQIERLAYAADDIATILGGACVIGSATITISPTTAKKRESLPLLCNKEYEYVTVTLSYEQITPKENL